MKDWSLARRDLLRRLGLGAAVLPLLRARRTWGAAAPRKRLLIIQMTQGYRQAYWKPAGGALADQTLPATVEPLAPFKQDLIFLPGLTNPDAGTNSRDAYRLMFYGLGATGPNAARQPAGPTLDQFIGSALPRPSGARAALNLGVMVERPSRPTTTPAESACFWAGANQPIHPLGDPYAVYRELFAVGADTAEAKRLILRRRSILDYVGTNLEEFGKRSGSEERIVMEGHRQAIRELEAQLQSLAESSRCGTAPPSPAADLNTDANYPIILDLHLRSMVAALKCGVTNVATLQLSDAAATGVDLNAFIPLQASAPGGRVTWRDVGHNPIFRGVDRKRLVDRWFMERIAGLLSQLRDVVEDGVPLLDSTVVLVGNNLEDGGNLNAQRLPWLLAGKGGGQLDTGRCLDSTGRPIAGVMAGICEALGLAKHPYGEALAGLKKP